MIFMHSHNRPILFNTIHSHKLSTFDSKISGEKIFSYMHDNWIYMSGVRFNSFFFFYFNSVSYVEMVENDVPYTQCLKFQSNIHKFSNKIWMIELHLPFKYVWYLYIDIGIIQSHYLEGGGWLYTEDQYSGLSTFNTEPHFTVKWFKLKIKCD